MQEAAFLLFGAVLAITASLAAATAVAMAAASADERLAGMPIPAGRWATSTSRAARAPARLATSESVEVDTPSQTTRTAREPGSGSAAIADASSLRSCRMPRSQHAATQCAGCSV